MHIFVKTFAGKTIILAFVHILMQSPFWERPLVIPNCTLGTVWVPACATPVALWHIVGLECARCGQKLDFGCRSGHFCVHFDVQTAIASLRANDYLDDALELAQIYAKH